MQSTEFDEALNYYVVHAGANIGRKFATAINQPARASARTSRYRQARSIPLHGFPFDLVYRVYPQMIVIIAMANQSRRPGYSVGRR